MSGSFLQSVDLSSELVFGSGNLIVVQEEGGGGVDAGFVQHFILSDFVKKFGGAAGANFRIILVLTHQSINHWTNVASKIGWNLSLCQEKGQVVVIDLVYETYKSLIQSKSETSGLNVEELFQRIKDASSPTTPTSGEKENKEIKQLILIEDLSSLLYQDQIQDQEDALKNERNVLGFLTKLKTLGIQNQGQSSRSDKGQSSVSVLTCVRCSGDDLEGRRWAKGISQILANVAFTVAPLSTGFSPNITGFLKTRNKLGVLNKGIQNYHYKLDDRSVKLSPIVS